MFHFPAFPPTHYEFTRRRPDTTLARFPHSDILGSTLACQLPEAYRRLQRPSSALHTKASTERPKTPTKQKTHTHTNPKTALNAPEPHTTTHHKQPEKTSHPHRVIEGAGMQRCSRPLYKNQTPHQHPEQHQPAHNTTSHTGHSTMNHSRQHLSRAVRA